MPRAYLQSEPGDVVERFVERISEYKTTVRRVARIDISRVAAEQCRMRGVAKLGIPSDLPAEWRPDGIDLVPTGLLDALALDALDGALTGCALAIAETGTIVLDAGPHQGVVRSRSFRTTTSASLARNRSLAGCLRPWRRSQ